MKFIRKGNLNKNFIPLPSEIDIISKYQKILSKDYKLIRCSHTMLNKSTFDASGQIRELLKENGIINFELVEKGLSNKVLKEIGLIVTPEGIIETTVSFYRPETKDGDPRFWPYNSKKHFIVDTLLYITVIDDYLVFIPVIENDSILSILENNFSSNEALSHIEYFKSLYNNHKGQWVESVSPFTSNPKDVGDTLENLLGLKANSSKKADLNGIIEIKSKRLKSGTNDSLFSKVPDWRLGPIPSATDMILKYGYVSQVHPGFMDLYITVNGKANNQNLFLENDHASNVLTQQHTKDGTTCIWQHEVLKERLFEKHPNTIWVLAEEKLIDNKIHFRYKDEMIFTSNPNFSQFLTLIDSSIITFDWRGKVQPDRKKYRDHGHGFRISPKNRGLLFSQELPFTT